MKKMERRSFLKGTAAAVAGAAATTITKAPFGFVRNIVKRGSERRWVDASA